MFNCCKNDELTQKQFGVMLHLHELGVVATVAQDTTFELCLLVWL